VLKKIELFVHYWNRKRLFEKKYREAAPYATRDSPFEQEKYARQLALIGDRRYRRALEVGCGEGVFLRQLAPLCDEVLGLDISSAAISRARSYCAEMGHARFVVGNIAGVLSPLAAPSPLMGEGGGAFDLIVATDILYYLGQEHDWNHMKEVLGRLCQAVAPGGRLLLTNCHTGFSHERDWLSLQTMRRYREECQNAGLTLIVEKAWHGLNGDHEVPYLMSLLEADLGRIREAPLPEGRKILEP